jgi:hypothetical protein
MASASKQTNTIRAKKMKARGRARKNKLALHGTTLSREELFKLQKPA